MVDSQSPAASDSKASTSARSPFAGCAIFICVGLVMAFLLVFSVVSLFRQYDAIAAFTSQQPAPVELTSLEDREADLNALAERVESFRQDLLEGEETSLLMDADDLNLAIAAYEPLKELRGTFHVAAIENEILRIPISWPLNGKPRLARAGESGVVTSDLRFLNATLIARPVLADNEIVLRIDSVEVPGKTIPPEFVEHLSPYRVTERYIDHPLIGPAMANLTAVEIQGDQILLRRKQGENPAHIVTDDQVDQASSRLFTVFAIASTVFLTLVGIVLLLSLRSRKAHP